MKVNKTQNKFGQVRFTVFLLPEIERKLKALAASEGKTISNYIEAEVIGKTLHI